MNKKIKREIDTKNSELKIIVNIDKEIWKKEQNIAFEKLSKKIKVPGFRPGKAPKSELKKYIATGKIWEEAVQKLLNVAVKDATKEIKKDEIILDSPTYSVEKITEEELEIIFIYPIFPEIKIKDYKKPSIKFNRATKKEIQEYAKKQLDKMLSKGALLLSKEDKNAKVEKGDTIIFDFKGFIDNKAFEGGEAEKFSLKIGSKSFIPGFEDQLLGKKLDWEGSIKVRFPKDYYKDDLKDKEAEFKIKIHEIKYEDRPEVNDEYVKSLEINNVSTKEELNDYLENLSKKELEEKERTRFINDLMTFVIDNNEIPVPRTIVLKELQALMKKFEENLKQQEVDKKEYYEITGYNDEKVKKELQIEAEKSIKKSILYTFFYKDLKLKVSDEDFERLNELVVDQLILIHNPDIKIEKEAIIVKKE